MRERGTESLWMDPWSVGSNRRLISTQGRRGSRSLCVTSTVTTAVGFKSQPCFDFGRRPSDKTSRASDRSSDDGRPAPAPMADIPRQHRGRGPAALRRRQLTRPCR